MQKIAALILVSLMIVSSFGQKDKSVKTEVDSMAYAIGVGMYQGISQLNLDLDIKMIYRGLKAAAKDESIFTNEDANKFIQDYLIDIEEKKTEENKAEGERFLKKNKTAEGVIATETGLQYKIIEQGDGPKPTAEDQVKVHYSGYLLDGTKFDSSVDRGEPAVFGVTQVIKGWTEVLQLMPEGSKYKVFIPSDLAYGDRGAGEDIKPGSVLVFDIELIEIQKK